MTRTLQDVRDRRINFHLQRLAHLKHAPAGCRCVYCMTTDEIEREFRARIHAEHERAGEPPF